MILWWYTCLLSLALVLAKGGQVKTISDPAVFDREVLGSRRAAFVKFFSPNCGHCVRMAPDWNRLGENMGEFVDIIKVDCSQSQLCNRYQVKGVPTLMIFSVSDVDDRRYQLKYEGPRELTPMIEYCKQHAASYVYRIKPNIDDQERKKYKRSVTLEEFLEKGKDLPKAILFRHGPAAVPFALKNLSVKFFGKVVVGMIHVPSGQAYAEQYSVKTGNDTFILIPPNKKEKIIYHKDEMKFTPLSDFLTKYASVTDWDKLEL